MYLATLNSICCLRASVQMGNVEIMTRIDRPFASGRVLLFTFPKMCAYTAFKSAAELRAPQQGLVALVASKLPNLGFLLSQLSRNMPVCTSIHYTPKLLL